MAEVTSHEIFEHAKQLPAEGKRDLLVHAISLCCLKLLQCLLHRGQARYVLLFHLVSCIELYFFRLPRTFGGCVTAAWGSHCAIILAFPR